MMANLSTLKRLIIFLAVLPFLNEFSYSQTLLHTKNELFILGTLSDYMGREIVPGMKGTLDRYDQTEGPLVDALDSIIKKTYPGITYRVDRRYISSEEATNYQINSDSLEKLFNHYYNFQQSGIYTSPDSQPILVGRLKQNIFQDKNDKLAFLAGVYVRFGRADDTAFYIGIANSQSKAELCFELFKELNCKPTDRIMYGNIPVGHLVYFHPNAEVKAYLLHYQWLRDKLANQLELLIKRWDLQYHQQIKPPDDTVKQKEQRQDN